MYTSILMNQNALRMNLVCHKMCCHVKHVEITRVPSRLQTDMIVSEPISQGRSEAETLNDFMRIKIYFPIIDTALTELSYRRRFSDDNIAILRTVCALMPGTENFLDADVLQPMTAHYKCNMDDFNLELRQMKRMIARKTIDNTMPDFDSEVDKLVAFANFVSKYDDAFFELNRLIGIAITLPVTSVEAERSISCLKLIKTHLRTTMPDDRLSDIAMLSVHSQRENAPDLDLVVDKFANKYPNCRIICCVKRNQRRNIILSKCAISHAAWTDSNYCWVTLFY